MRAADAAAAGGFGAMAEEFRTDLVTLGRVRRALRTSMAGEDVLSRHEHLELPAETLEHRTCTWLPRIWAHTGARR